MGNALMPESAGTPDGGGTSGRDAWMPEAAIRLCDDIGARMAGRDLRENAPEHRLPAGAQELHLDRVANVIGSDTGSFGVARGMSVSDQVSQRINRSLNSTGFVQAAGAK